jgi:hypothetical protein
MGSFRICRNRILLLPDVQAYYDIRASQFIYFETVIGTIKILTSTIQKYDLYNGYKVVLNDYHGRTPYTYYKKHKAKYYKGYKENHKNQ